MTYATSGSPHQVLLGGPSFELRASQTPETCTRCGRTFLERHVVVRAVWRPYDRRPAKVDAWGADCACARPDWVSDRLAASLGLPPRSDGGFRGRLGSGYARRHPLPRWHGKGRR